MLNFCIKCVHSLLSFPIFKDHNETLETPHRGRNIFSPATGLRSITSPGNTLKSANVIESTTIKPQPSTTEPAVIKPPPSTPATITAGKKDPGGIGFLDEVGGSVDGLMSCTESLGFESSDERLTGNETGSRTSAKKWRRAAAEDKAGEEKKFPPPLSSLSQRGKPMFFLRPVRRDGRLELTEVRIDRLEVLRASREDGRLRLSLVTDLDVDEEEREGSTSIIEEEEEKEVREGEERQEDREEEERGEKWVFPVGNVGVRRCHEVASHHHNHHVPAWSKHCLTIR